MNATKRIRNAIDVVGCLSTEDAKIKAAARRLRERGEVQIETYAANCVRQTKRGFTLFVREGYHITPATGA